MLVVALTITIILVGERNLNNIAPVIAATYTWAAFIDISMCGFINNAIKAMSEKPNVGKWQITSTDVKHK